MTILKSKLDKIIINSEINILRKVGVQIIKKKNSIIIRKKRNLKNIIIVTNPYPGFPTDLQAQLMSLMCLSNGKSKIKETIIQLFCL